VDQVPASRTWPLRQAVLRPHQPVEQMRLPDDDHPLAAAFIAADGRGDIIGTSWVAPAPAPVAVGHHAPGGSPAWRLRGMATRQDLRNQGIGRAVLSRAVGHVSDHGGGLLWCFARVPAEGFYAQAGFSTEGDLWDEADIGPHVLMWRLVEGGVDRTSLGQDPDV
jgi:GNAT superfamily N-acetyltransferase